MTGLIILAAGGSSRLGFPKQTLLYKGKTLIEIAIEAGIGSKCSTVNVVLGANAAGIQNTIQHYPIHIIDNPDWKEGMASSIRLAVKTLQTQPEIDSLIIMLCDQPFVTRATIDNLLYKQQETGKKIIASAYNGTNGVPILFSRSFFDELVSLKGREGAKKILVNHTNNMASVHFKKGGIDIDTIADYENLINDT